MQLILIPLIRGIVIYPVDSAIPPFKNSGLLFLLPEGGSILPAIAYMGRRRT